MTVALCISAWCLSGIASFVFWWTKYQDLTVDDLCVGGMIACVFGPVTWMGAWLICGGSKHVVVRQRGPR